MRKSILFLAAALIAGGAACKKTDSEKAATEVRKARENVDDQAKDLRKQVEDVNKEVKDVAKESKDLGEAETRLANARVNLQALVKNRIASIDDKLATLDTRPDPISKKFALDLRTRRNTVFDRSNVADSIAIGSWDSYKKDVEDQLTGLETDLNKSLDIKKGDSRNEPGVAP
jgi:chromosome segregation ATPase